MIINWEDWEVLRKADGKEHEFLHHKLTGEQRFLKFLRENGQYRLKEAVSELISGEAFNTLGLGLNSIFVTRIGRPAIFMDKKEDARFLDFSKQFVIDKIEQREYTAARLFTLDLLLKNTNREKSKLEHIGWENLDNGGIKIYPLDNGQTLGYGQEDTSLDDDGDLDKNFNEVYVNHFSTIICPNIPSPIAEQTLVELRNINFEEICKEVTENVINVLAPIDDEKNFLKERMSKISSMITRRVPKIENKITQWLGINVSQSQLPLEAQPQVN